MADGVDGKKPGWFPYDPEASEEVENLYQQHLDNDKVGRIGGYRWSPPNFKHSNKNSRIWGGGFGIR